MNTSKFYKKLTQAEVGQTKTHEVYIRMPNDFDYETFFNNAHIENGNVIEVNFSAPTTSYKSNPISVRTYDFRFVYFANSNKEKRIPGLGPLFRELNIGEGDIVCIERRDNDDGPQFTVSFYSADQIQISPASVLISAESYDSPMTISAPLDEPLQQIFFGAPGTGKSFRINEVCAQYDNYRTTFHPDTDYASFVGAYKPITKSEVRYDIYSKPIKDENGNVEHEDRIVYRYVFQAFLKAYIAAWREQQNENPKPVFLVVEEINRGNCAQIFGDIFQLLDRNESGYSDYPIVADDDLAQELERKFENLTVANAEAINSLYKGGKDIVGSVKSGKELLLPNNLYIWATMNTSDQSLFPIDSAFKRRWDWKYIKIKDAKKDYKIQFSNGNVYDWWSFVTEINIRIEGGEIQQEDKKLGYFFAKSKDGIITADRFLSKVIFFLYNDVFKDFGFDEDYFKGADGQPMTFASYFDEAGEPNEAQIERFLNNLGLLPLKTFANNDNEEMAFEEMFDDSTSNENREIIIDGSPSSRNNSFTTITNIALNKARDEGRSLTIEELTKIAQTSFITPTGKQMRKEIFLMDVDKETYLSSSKDQTAKDRYKFQTPLIDTNEVKFYCWADWGVKAEPSLARYADALNVKAEGLNRE